MHILRRVIYQQFHTQRMLVKAAMADTVGSIPGIGSIPGSRIGSWVAEKVVGVTTRFNEVNRLLANRVVRKLRRLPAEPSLEEMTARTSEAIQKRAWSRS